MKKTGLERRVFLLIVTGLLIILLSTSVVAAADQVILDWEQDAAGNAITSGQVIDDEYSSATGISVTVSAASASGVAAIFPSNNPPADLDLGSPNQSCPGGGPGVGLGGEVGQPGENCISHGNVLIMPTIGDGDADGFIDGAPNDDDRGGTITFLFSEPVKIDYIEVLDQESSESLDIESYSDVGATNLLDTQSPAGFGNNSYEFITIGVDGVSRVDFDFVGSGAIASLAYTPSEPTAVSLSTLNASVAVPPTYWLGLVALMAVVTVAGLWLVRYQTNQSRRAPVRVTTHEIERKRFDIDVDI